MKVGDLVEWTVDGDVGIIVRTGGYAGDVKLGYAGYSETPWSAKVQVHWSNGELEWMWAKQDGLKLISKSP